MNEALQALPLLFSICGVAQASAGMAACEEAQGIAATAAERARRSLLVAAESVQEHAGRLLLDWPRLFFDASPRLEELAVLRRSVAALRRALGGGIGQAAAGGMPPDMDLSVASEQLSEIGAALAHGIFAMSPVDWLQIRDWAALRGWYRRATTVAARTLGAVEDCRLEELGRSSVGVLPRIKPGAFSAVLDADAADGFTARPVWNGQTCETGPLVRQGRRSLVVELQRLQGNGLMTRLVARLAELASLPRRMGRYLQVIHGGSGWRPMRRRGGGGASDMQSGIGIVETARGCLVHRVNLRGGIVERYRIVAPTEWNFHPEGALAQALLALPVTGAQELRRRVAMLVVALDPCVEHEVIVEPAPTEDPQKCVWPYLPE